jgi:hypothetical protein
MNTFVIDSDNSITVFGAGESVPKTEGSETFKSIDELQQLAGQEGHTPQNSGQGGHARHYCAESMRAALFDLRHHLQFVRQSFEPLFRFPVIHEVSDHGR